MTIDSPLTITAAILSSGIANLHQRKRGSVGAIAAGPYRRLKVVGYLEGRDPLSKGR